MRKLAVLILGLLTVSVLTLVFISCGEETYKSNTVQVPGPAGKDGSNGVNGKDGSQGTTGTNGLNSLLSLSRFTADTSICAAGSGSIVRSGLDNNSNNILEASEVNQSTVVCDGIQGQQGNQGVQGNTGATGAQGAPGTPAPQYAILKFITPCPSITTSYREVIIKLVNGQFLSSFSANGDALTVRLTLIPNGSYVDTDGSNCHFTVSGTTLTDQFGNTF